MDFVWHKISEKMTSRNYQILCLVFWIVHSGLSQGLDAVEKPIDLTFNPCPAVVGLGKTSYHSAY